MTWKHGDDVIVTFCGLDHRGEWIGTTGKYVLTRILIDPLYDYGEMGPRLAPISYVCVEPSDIRGPDGS